MHIEWLGHSCFRFSNDGCSIVIDPHDGRSVGLKTPDTDADIVLMSHDHFDHNASSAIKGKHEDHKFHNGEFSSHGIDFCGFPTFHDPEKGKLRGKNTVYMFSMDGVSVCHCGDLGCMPDADVIDSIRNVDMLFVPVGGKYTMPLKETIDFVRKVSPNVVVPMHYLIDGLTVDISGPEGFINGISLPLKKVGSSVDIEKKDIPGTAECLMFEYGQS